MTELDRYLETKRKVERKRREADRLQGAYDQALAELERELGVSSLEEGEAALELLRTKAQKAEALRDERLAEFNREAEGKL